ncbi:hypoxanthine phosphoribosyltransferase [Vulgatibacter sp.]|uniref:hypoxanthine phosphoribosyltransferase n=1 Tax=Vulgatibacter sp. TaxID=1971226 RepID=UPI003567154B
MQFAEMVEVMLSREELAARVRELGEQITRDFAGKELVMVGVLKGSFVFFADLVRSVDLPLRTDFLSVSSYGGSNTESTGVVKFTQDLSRPIAGQHVILVEDIVDTGLTMKYLLENLQTRHPASLSVCSLLEKPERAKVEIDICYKGFTIPDAFVVGYGLDYDERYRNLPFLGVLKQP